MKRTIWKTAALLTLVALSASLAGAKPKKSGYKSAEDSGETAAALKTATEDFVRVEAGSFMMGICEERSWYGDKDAVHSVTLTRSFYICDHEVTNAEYKAVMGKTYRLSKGDNLPVTWVTWDNAIDYCNALSEMQGLTPCYTKEKGKVTCDFSANGYRLPTDAEWEYAARAGDNSTEVRVWSGIHEELEWDYDRTALDNAVGEYAWFEYNSGNKLHPGKEKKPNAWGLYDMIGNVHVWCWDWYASSSSEPATDPTGPAVGSSTGGRGPTRIIRGGAGWDCGPGGSTVATRGSSEPGERHPWRGFRVCRTAED